MIAPQTDLARRKSDTTARLCNLPSFQPTALRLLTVSADCDSALDEYEHIFRADPALASEVLQRANSAEFGLRSRIADIRGSLVFLGIERTRQLAVTIAMRIYTTKSQRRNDTRPIWLHSMATAVIAEELARMAGHRGFNHYTAALMHDLGRLGLLASCGDEYNEMLSQTYRNLGEESELERIAFGLRHTEAGMFLAKSWNFPPPLCDTILCHHEPENSRDDHLVGVVSAACYLASRMGYPEVAETEPVQPEGTAAAQLTALPESEYDRLNQLVGSRISLF